MWETISTALKEYGNILAAVFTGIFTGIGWLITSWARRVREQAEAAHARQQHVDKELDDIRAHVARIEMTQIRQDGDMTELRTELIESRRQQSAELAAIRRELALGSKMEEERFDSIYRLLKAIDTRSRASNPAIYPYQDDN